MTIRFANKEIGLLIIILFGLVTVVFLIPRQVLLFTIGSFLLYLLYQWIFKLCIPRYNRVYNSIYLYSTNGCCGVDEAMYKSFVEQYERVEKDKNLTLYLNASSSNTNTNISINSFISCCCTRSALGYREESNDDDNNDDEKGCEVINSASYCFELCSILQKHKYPITCIYSGHIRSTNTVVVLMCDNYYPSRFNTSLGPVVSLSWRGYLSFANSREENGNNNNSIVTSSASINESKMNIEFAINSFLEIIYRRRTGMLPQSAETMRVIQTKYFCR